MYPVTRSLTWPDSVAPLDLPDFETQARRLRYQALGNACRERLINWLLVAHHDDDQAETVLMRLASGHKGLGLQGMSLLADIPECWGMHGVYRSGKWEAIALRLRREEEKDPSSEKAQILRRALARPDILERGGVRILRPLLDFSKERLIETCRARALGWEEDKTNEDTWRTPRNNIRALLRSAKLPQALQKSSMLQLAKKTSDTFQKKSASVGRIVDRCEILLFDVRCGGLVVRLPSRMTIKVRRGDAYAAYRKSARLSAMLLLRTFVLPVTPQEEVSLHSLEQAAVSIFPDLNDNDIAVDKTLQPTNFTGGGVQFQRLHSPLAAPLSELNPAISTPWGDLDPVFVWMLTRQPFSKNPLTLTVQPPANAGSPIADHSPSWSSWQLWDGRYWIRLLNRSSRPLIVRSFQPSDLQHLHYTLSRARYKELHHLLHLTVPGKVRWTLLAIAETGGDSLPTGQLLALPTLGQVGTFDIGDVNGEKKVEWQIRYKLVGLGLQQSYDDFNETPQNSNLTSL